MAIKIVDLEKFGDSSLEEIRVSGFDSREKYQS